MSMTLKKGQKAFKPKFPTRKPGGPGSAPSSTRPSVERQSQTPVPHLRPTELISIPDHDDRHDLFQESALVQHTTQPSDLESPTSSTQEPKPGSQNISISNARTSNNASKRILTDEEDHGSTQKRPRLDTSELSGDAGTPWIRDGVEKSNSTVADTPMNQIGVEHARYGLSQGLSGTQTSRFAQSLRTETFETDEGSPLPQDPPVRSAPQTSTARTPDQANNNSSSLHTIAGSLADNESNTMSSLHHVEDSENVRESAQVFESVTSHHPASETRQDDPSSLYPDPELSGVPLAQNANSGQTSAFMKSAVSNTDGATMGHLVPTAALNPDGTPVSNVVPAAGLNPDGTPREPVQGSLTKAKKRTVTKRRRIVQAEQEGDDVRPTIEMQINRPRRNGGSKRIRKKKEGDRRRKKRGETPDGAEDEIIDRSEMTMAELCKDLKIGEKSSRHEQMKQQINEARMKAKEARLAKKLNAARPSHSEGASGGEIAAGIADAEDVEGAEGAEKDAQSAIGPELLDAEEDRAVGPQYILVGDTVTLNPRSLEARRNDSPPAQGKSKNWKDKIVVKENEFSNIVTSGSYMKREPAQLWDATATAAFYIALSMFGTNFEMMSKMFPTRTRRQLKLKYAKESRDNPWKLDKIEKGPKMPIDFNYFKKHSNEKLVEAAEIKAELQRYADEERQNEEAMRKEREAIEIEKRATIRKGNSAARGLLAAVGDDDSGNENSHSGRSGPREASAAPKRQSSKKGMKKNIHSGGYQDPNNYTVVGRED